MKATFYLVNDRARQSALDCVSTAPVGHVVQVKDQTRTLAQNAAQWPYLHAFSQQLKWPVNGEMVHMDELEWKDVLTAGFRNETVRIAMGLHGGVVMLGGRTSEMLKPEFSEWLDFLKAEAVHRGVVVYAKEQA